MTRHKGDRFDAIKPEIPQLNKYTAGFDKPVNFYDIKASLPVFSFKAINLNSTSLCYNNKELTAEHYIKLLTRLRNISNVSYEELDKGGKAYRFHTVDFNAKNVSLTIDEYKKSIFSNPEKVDDENIPVCYQLDVFGIARIMGYLGYQGVFYLVWFDLNHQVYS